MFMSANKVATVKVPKHLNITMIDNFHQTMMPIIESESEIILDASDVEKVDSVGIQMLFSLKKTVEDHNQIMHLENVPEVLIQTAKQLGFEKKIGLEL